MPSSIRKVKTRDKEVNLKRILQNEKKRVRFIFLFGGILLIGCGLYLSSSDFKRQVPTNSTDSFAFEPIKIDKSLLQGKKKKNSPTRIIVPELNIDLAVMDAKIINGLWQVFPDTAGFGEGSVYPEETGNTVIFAHARKGLFLSLKNASLGQKIYILSDNKWFSYTIRDIKEVLPAQTEIIAPTSDSTLTLYTCSGFADSKRLIVIGKRD